MKILLGITGSVATVLTLKLIQALITAGHEVKVVATAPALYFLNQKELVKAEDVTNTLSLDCDGVEVTIYTDKYEWALGAYHKNDPVEHINFRNWADLFLIAPLTANTLAKISNGITDNFLCCIARAWPKDKPFLIAPAMNTEMWVDPITTEQIEALIRRYQKLRLIEPIEKKLACGDIGQGALANIDTIIEAIKVLTFKII